jgi:predicted nucleic acid-binding protein
MILVDTSVLIGYLRGLIGAVYTLLDDLIVAGAPFGINSHIYLEVLQGARNQQEFDQLREYLCTLPFYTVKSAHRSYENAALLYMRCRKAGVTVRSTIDVLIAETAIENRLYLLHNDRDFVNMARVITELKLYNT